MSRERYGPWKQVSFCVKCPFVAAKEIKWMHPFFQPVCPRCGSTNDGYLFRSATARRVTTRWGRFVRTEFKDPDRVARLRGREQVNPQEGGDE